MGKITNFLRWIFADKADTKIVTEVGNCVDYKSGEIIDIKTDPGFSHAEITPTVIEEVKTIKKKPIVKKSTEQIVEELKEVDKQKVVKKAVVKKDTKVEAKTIAKTDKKTVSKKPKKKNVKK